MSQPPVDREELVQLLDGDPIVIATIIDSFLRECPEYMEGIRQGVAEHDAGLLEQHAHGLKGSAGSIRAKPASDAAAVLEQMGQSGDFSEAEDALEALEDKIDRLTDELVEIRRDVQE